MAIDFDGVPEIIAKVANKTDNETVKEKWEELKTLVHLVHKDEILRQRKKLDEWKSGMDDVNKKISRLQQSSWGVGVEDNDYDFDVSYSGGSISLGDYGSTTSMSTTFEPYEQPQMELKFPMTEQEEYENAGLTEEQKQLRAYYQKILKAVHKSGAFLGPYVENHYYNKAHTDGYDHRIYSFVRYDDKEVVLVVSNFEKDKNYKIDLKLDPNIVSLLQLNKDDYDLSDLLTNDTSKLHISEEIGHVSMDLKPLESRIFLFKR